MTKASVLPCGALVNETVRELVEDNLGLVAHLVRERIARVPSHVRRDELTSAGMMALVVSAQSYEAGRGVPFVRFAAIRIRGALMDELRGMDWATRSLRCRARAVESTRADLAVVLDRAPDKREVAAALRVSPRELDSLQSELTRASVLSLQNSSPATGSELPPEPSAGPESLILQRERIGYLYDAISALSTRLRFVVDAYFFQARQMRDIATELGVTESRVSQLCAQALCLLRDGMNSQLDPSALDERGQSGRTVAARHVYFGAIASHGTLSTRLAVSSPRGDVLRRLSDDRVKIARGSARPSDVNSPRSAR